MKKLGISVHKGRHTLWSPCHEPAPSHYLNHCWNIVNWTLRDKLYLSKFIRFSFQESAIGNVIRKIAAVLSRSKCGKTSVVQLDYGINLSWKLSRHTSMYYEIGNRISYSILKKTPPKQTRGMILNRRFNTTDYNNVFMHLSTFPIIRSKTI